MGGKPKKKCCSDTPRCARCPIRMLAEGRLPAGYTVHKRRLTKTGKNGVGTNGAAKKRAPKHGGATKATVA